MSSYITIKGVLKGPDGKPVPFGNVSLTASLTSYDVIDSTNVSCKSDKDGNYTLIAHYGRYRVTITKGRDQLDRGTIVIDEYTPREISINELLVAFNRHGMEVTWGVEEAPQDGRQYARQDRKWQVVKGGVGSSVHSVNGELPDLQGNVQIDYVNVGALARDGKALTAGHSDTTDFAYALTRSAVESIIMQSRQGMEPFIQDKPNNVGKGIRVNNRGDGWEYFVVGDQDGAKWGAIAGVIEDQLDLMAKLDGKEPVIADKATNVGKAIRVDATGNNWEFYTPASQEPAWGTIIGDIANQADLQDALNLKQVAAPIGPSFVGVLNGVWTERNPVTQINDIEAPIGGGKVLLTALNVGAEPEIADKKGNVGKTIRVNSTGDGWEYFIPAVPVLEWGEIKGDIEKQLDLASALSQREPVIENKPLNIGKSIRVNAQGTGWEYFNPSSGGGKAEWGFIAGDIANQLDLQTELAKYQSKAPMLGGFYGISDGQWVSQSAVTSINGVNPPTGGGRIDLQPGQIGALPISTFSSHLQVINPHKITPDMIDALSNTVFDNHLLATNPHGVTTDIIGAASKLALAALTTELHNHEKEVNPHGLTPESIQAEPVISGKEGNVGKSIRVNPTGNGWEYFHHETPEFIRVRGYLDAMTNAITGDALNTTLECGVAPNLESPDDKPSGVAYVVTVANPDFEICTGIKMDVSRGDLIMWSKDAGNEWVHLDIGVNPARWGYISGDINAQKDLIDKLALYALKADLSDVVRTNTDGDIDVGFKKILAGSVRVASDSAMFGYHGVMGAFIKGFGANDGALYAGTTVPIWESVGGIEKRLVLTINNASPDENGNIDIASGGSSWGSIIGTIDNQTDLIAKFGEYLPLAGGDVDGTLYVGSNGDILLENNVPLRVKSKDDGGSPDWHEVIKMTPGTDGDLEVGASRVPLQFYSKTDPTVMISDNRTKYTMLHTGNIDTQLELTLKNPGELEGASLDTLKGDAVFTQKHKQYATVANGYPEKGALGQLVCSSAGEGFIQTYKANVYDDSDKFLHFKVWVRSLANTAGSWSDWKEASFV
ncbi:hypothetical protein VCR15J2_390134 [Vibrio coralliirubri]|uniref:prophage tail fiber N-terminal domain-containing protein n=1 Tax=Vibrio coralliirubri TaxID=1516159 RepID=UPI0006302E65|nr:prophage tail fiber N-terminal domain-containing protein [Vibrio coralliirubri]CDT54129.1 hypothetical protein VCR15J2_390134 [Vibrio coralliirubri]